MNKQEPAPPVQMKAPWGAKFGIKIQLNPIVGIFLTIFVDLLAFGLFLPDIQLRAKELGLSGVGLGLTIAAFSVAQLLCAPILGRLSDNSGRRVVLLISTFLSTIAYLLYADAATSLLILVVSRLLSGAASANVGVAFAYVADTTTKAERPKAMGLLGMAFGLGFVLGPVIGGGLLAANGGRPLLLGIAGAALSFLNFAYVALLLPEPVRAKPEPQVGVQRKSMFVTAFSDRNLAILLALFFTINLGMSNLEATYFQLLADPRSVFHLTDVQARVVGAFILACVGVFSAFAQGFLVRFITPRFGEVNVIRWAYVAMVPVFALVPFLPLWVPAFCLTICLATILGVSNPNLSSLTSKAAPPELQGGIFGINQALGALARLTGPIVSNLLFVKAVFAPYFLGSGLFAVGVVIAFRLHHTKDEAIVIAA